MAIERNPDSLDRFATGVLPWLVGAGGLLVYLITLNRWVSFQSIEIMSQVSGLLWRPVVTHPLTWAVLSFFKLLPESSIPLALNVFAAVCAAVILGLLARTVALLPHINPGDARERSRSGLAIVPAGWIPPVLAAAACGLQLTFWEHATAVSGEMINLLILAYIVRCLFEFRADGRDRWLGICAFCYGAGMANDWGLIGFLPVFLTALIWLKRMSFFTWRSLLRLAVSGLAGAGIYLLLPLADSFSSLTPVGFWEVLNANWYYETESLLTFPEWTLLLLTLMILLPVLVITLVRKPEKKEEGGDNPLALFLGKGSLRAAHALFLGLSVWVALDLPFSPRKVGFGQPLLPYYYLNALVMGYCAGYLLQAGLGSFRSESLFLVGAKLIAKVGAYWVCVLVVALPLELVWRNYAELRWTNGPAVRCFAEQLYDGLPPGKSVALSDSTEQTVLLQAALAAHGHDKDALLVDLAALPSRQYQLSMARRFGRRWPMAPSATGPRVFSRAELLDFVTKLGAREQLVCLNPVFSYYQEPYVDQPRGLVHFLVPRAPNDLSIQQMDGATAAANELRWQKQWTDGVKTLTERVRLESFSKMPMNRTLVGRAFLGREENRTAGGLRNAYARAFDDWGVQLQRHGQWREGGVWFQRALILRPDSLAPRINFLYNQQHQHGETRRLDLHQVENELRGQFANYATWERVIFEGGPVDEPTFLGETARVMLFEGNNRQAAVDYARCVELAPDWAEGRLWFAQSLVAIGNFERALAVAGGIQPGRESLNGSQLAQLLYCRVSALRGLGRTNESGAAISRFVHEHSQENEVLLTAVQLCVRERQYELALALLNQLLAREPENVQWLSNKAMVQMEMAQPTESIVSLNAALALSPTNQLVRLNRAVVLLKTGELDAARDDYEVLLKDLPHSRPVLFGLEEIAWRRQHRSAAMELCQQYLATGIQQTAEYRLVSNHLRTLQSPTKIGN